MWVGLGWVMIVVILLVGLGWVCLSVGLVGLGQGKWTHGQLCIDLIFVGISRRS